MSTTTPRDADGAKLCAWCGSEIKQSGVGRSRDYCRRTRRRARHERPYGTEPAGVAAYAYEPERLAGELGISQGSLGPERSRCLGCLRRLLTPEVAAG